MGNNATKRLREARIEELESTIAKNAEDLRTLSMNYEDMEIKSARQIQAMHEELVDLQNTQSNHKEKLADLDYQVEKLDVDMNDIMGKVEELHLKFKGLLKDHEESKKLLPGRITGQISKELIKWNYTSSELERKYTEMRSYFTELIENCHNNNANIEDLSEKVHHLEANDSGIVLPCRCPNESNISHREALSADDIDISFTSSEKSCYDVNLVKINKAIKVMKEQIKVDEEFSKADTETLDL